MTYKRPVNNNSYTVPRKITQDLTGKQFGRLSVVSVAGNYKKAIWWNCQCLCGNVAQIPTGRLNFGTSTSCGCLTVERAAAAHRTHGMCGTSEYRAWVKMLDKCRNPKNSDYSYYGGRGIKVALEWLKFSKFFSDMGPRPEAYTLERIDVNGPYSAENCTWASRKAQTRNRRNTLNITYQGETKPIAEWSEISGIPYSTLKARLVRLKYNAEDCLTKKVKCGEKLANKEYKPRKLPNMSKVPRGFGSKSTKVSREMAIAIQEKYDTARYTFSSLAREYGLSVGTSSKICQRKSFFNIHHA